MQILSFLSIFCVLGLAVMNFRNVVSINIISEKFASLFHTSSQSLMFDMAIYTIFVFVLGVITVALYVAPLYDSLKEKYTAYKRELERGSISNTSAESKIQVLQNKISVLETALNDALNKRGRQQ